MVSPGKTVTLIATAVANTVYVIPLIIHAVYVIKDFNSIPSKKPASLIANAESKVKDASVLANVHVKMIVTGMGFALMKYVHATKDSKDIHVIRTQEEKLITTLYLA